MQAIFSGTVTDSEPGEIATLVINRPDGVVDDFPALVNSSMKVFGANYPIPVPGVYSATFTMKATSKLSAIDGPTVQFEAKVNITSRSATLHVTVTE